MDDVLVKAIEIRSAGDPSVGWFGATWTIEGPEFLLDSNDIGLFKQKLLEAWQVVADDADVFINPTQEP